METSEQLVQQEAAPEVTAPLCAAAVATHGPPPSSWRPTSSMRQQPAACPSVPEDREWTEERRFPKPGFFLSGNLWNLYLQSASTNPGPTGSFMRHVTAMKSPTNPTYVTTRQWPVPDVMHLRTEANFQNIAAHQAYLEMLQFEQNALRSWSNMVQDQIMGEAAQSGGNKRDKLKGTNAQDSQFFADFRRFLLIFAFPGNYSISGAQIFAGNRRFSQKTAGNRRKPQIFAETRLSHLVCPF